MKEAFTAETKHFADCLLHGTKCICPASDGVTVMKIVNAVYESSKTGNVVSLV
jgi:predicted dehydrogenase